MVGDLHSRSDYEDLLVFFFFGPDDDLLRACRRRAYRDMSRTLHGIRGNTVCFDNADKVLEESFHSIASVAQPTQAKFDDWHQITCERLRESYHRDGYPKFTVGQGQKWINMTFKYIFVMGERRLKGFSHLYDFCHAPLDDYFMCAVPNFPRLGCPWSRMNDYGAYLDRQRWIRNQYQDPPLKAEYDLWLAEAKRRRKAELAAREPTNRV
jgi:hypothetical protein